MSEVEDLRAEVERLRRGGRELGRIVDWQCKAVLDATGMDDWTDVDGDGDWAVIWEALEALRPRAEAAEAKLRDVEALADEAKRLAVTYWAQDSTYLTHATVWSDVTHRLRAVLARSQAPQTPAGREGPCGNAADRLAAAPWQDARTGRHCPLDTFGDER